MVDLILKRRQSRHIQALQRIRHTCKAWKERFGIQYTYCGCPSSGGDTIGKRLSRFYSRFPSGNPRKPTQRRQSLPLSQWLQWDVKERFLKHQEPMKSRAEKVVKERRRRNSLYLENDQRDRVHELAFLYPVPMFHPPPVDGGCVAFECERHQSCRRMWQRRWPVWRGRVHSWRMLEVLGAIVLDLALKAWTLHVPAVWSGRN
ncbi:hypothetical protein BKA70DRAFT_1222962 [Coprinopsis sp. MPI-PUGE-AT-0042]|nr:hypothetical protein BKA70DRAFT_1222962 [Coprinopsis sp. MPI-PUGE-AT-0042]